MARREFVRHSLPRASRRRRTAAERLALAQPKLAAMQARSFFKQSPHAAIRRRLFPRQIAAMFSALNRRDWDLFVGPPYGPIVEVDLHADAGMPVGLRESYRGAEPMRRMVEDWEEPWEQFHVQPLELVDFGNCYIVLLRYHARGVGSGVEIEATAASLIVPPGHGYRVELFWNPEPDYIRHTMMEADLWLAGTKDTTRWVGTM